MRQTRLSQTGKPFTVEIRSSRRNASKTATSSLWAGIDLAAMKDDAEENTVAGVGEQSADKAGLEPAC